MTQVILLLLILNFELCFDIHCVNTVFMSAGKYGTGEIFLFWSALSSTDNGKVKTYYTFHTRTSKILMRLNILVFRRFQSQNVILFSFSMKHSYPLMTTITPDVNNWRYFMKGWGDFINWWLIGDKEYFNTTLEEYKVTYLMEHSITSQKMTLTVFMTFFC